MLPSYMALLAELARELGEADIAKSDPNERANTVRRALAGKRALFVIDNLETLDETERMRVFQFLARRCRKATRPSSPAGGAATWTPAPSGSTAWRKPMRSCCWTSWRSTTRAWHAPPRPSGRRSTS